MIFGIPKFNLRFETLPKPFSEENNFWKVGTIFGIPNFMEIFQKLFSSENWFGEVWKFKGIFGIADKSLEDSKSIFGIPNFMEFFKNYFREYIGLVKFENSRVFMELQI